MIKALKRKFIFTAMTAVTVLLVILLGLINTANAVGAVSRTDNLLEDIARLQTVPEPLRKGEQLPGNGAARKLAESEDTDGKKRLFIPPLTENDRMAAVYFSVSFSSVKETVSVDVSHIANISGDEAEKLALSVFDGADSGRTGSYKYIKTFSPDKQNSTFVFMDVTSERTSVLRVGVLSLLAGIACWWLMFFIVSFLSGRAIKPISENFEKQKRFVTDAGHEIKTPLAVILANTEAMELYCGENKWSKNIREQTVRLNTLMQNLLLLAKSDEGEMLQNAETVSLSDTANAVFDMFSEPFSQRGLSLETDICSGVFAKINPSRAEMLFSALVDNAVKYSKENSTVKAKLSRRAENAVFEITNLCIKLPDCEPERLFDRFFRADEARTQKDGGSGIGLSAAKSIAEGCGGSIKAEYRPGGVIAFTVIFKAE